MIDLIIQTVFSCYHTNCISGTYGFWRWVIDYYLICIIDYHLVSTIIFQTHKQNAGEWKVLLLDD